MTWLSFDFNTFWRLPKRWHNPPQHTIQKSCFTSFKSCGLGPNVAMCFKYMFAQLFLEFRDLSTCRKCLKIVAVSEYTDILNKMFIHTHRLNTPMLQSNFSIVHSKYRSKHCAVHIARLSMAIPDGHDGSPCIRYFSADR